MKKICFLIIFTLYIFFLKVDVYASSANLSVSSNSVYVGESFSVTVNLSDVAAWNVKASADGPVSGCSIVEADVTSNALNTSKSFSVSCKTTGVGSVVVRLFGDISSSDLTTYDISDEKVVSVIRKKDDDIAPTGTNNSNNSSSNSNNTSKNNNSTGNSNNSKNNSNSSANDDIKKSDDKSSNVGIKSLTIDGEKLKKIDDNNYQVDLSYSTKMINVKVETEDSKSKVFGAGSHKINVGKNNISVVIVAEDGSKNKINIKVVRSDGYTLDDLDDVLSKDGNDIIDIKLEKNYIIPSKIIKSIKKSNKKVSFNFYDKNYQLMYSWIIDGSKIKEIGDFDTSVLYSSNNKNNIIKLSGYSDGVYLSFKFKYIPIGTQLNLYVGDKYSNKDVLNIFNYNEKKNALYNVSLKKKIDNGFIKFSIDHNYDYFITNSKNIIGNSHEKKVSIVFFGICFVVLVVATVVFIKRKKK